MNFQVSFYKSRRVARLGCLAGTSRCVLQPQTMTNISAVSLSELHDGAEKDIVTARRGMEATLKHHLEERYEDHAYLVKVQFNVCIC
jgi:hypothetical protein